jgi:hypothetical protein
MHSVVEGPMPITWIQLTRTVWVAGLQHYRAVVINISNVWVARVEDGDVLYPANITFHGIEGAKAWAERKLHELADSPA